MLKAIGNVVALLFTLSSFLVSAWAEPRLLADDEMDGIYAQGVVINLGVQLGFPEGRSFSIPSFDLPVPGRGGSNPGRTTFPGSGVNLSGNALQGAGGLSINAATAAISMTVNVVLANNSIVGGNIIQNTSSLPTNLVFSFPSFSP